MVVTTMMMKKTTTNRIQGKKMTILTKEKKKGTMLTVPEMKSESLQNERTTGHSRTKGKRILIILTRGSMPSSLWKIY
jgi:hypothetical protein